MKQATLASATGIFCILAGIGCSVEKPIAVRKAVVHYGMLRTVVPETGILELPNVVAVPATLTGNIVRIYASAGARVARGQAMARLIQIGNAPAERLLAAQTALSKAATEVREDKRSADSDAYLYEHEGIARDVLMQSRARLEQARISYQEARKELRLLHDDGSLVRAPCDGTVESTAAHPNDELRSIEEGDPVTTGQTLFTIATHDDFVVRAKIDEQDIFAIKPGQRVIVSGEDLGDRILDGRMVALAPIVRRSDDPSSTARNALATIRLKKRLPFLRDGMAVDVDVITHDERNVLTIPPSAVRHDAQGPHVFVVRNNGVDTVHVTLGARNDTAVVVRSGLRNGETIIADPTPFSSP